MKKCLLILITGFPFFANSQNITTIAGSGTSGYSGNGEKATLAELNDPWVARLHNGNIYIADGENNYIREINSLGIITTIAGNGGYGHAGNGGAATNAQLADPSDITFDSEGNLYISDDCTIRKVTTAGIITTIAGTGTLGETGDNGPAVSAQLADPLGLVSDTFGNLYFSDDGMYRVRKINSLGIITTIAGTGTIGYSGDNGPATIAEISQIGYLGMDHSGNLFLPDYGSGYGSRVRKIDAETGIITTVAGNGTYSNTGDGNPATAATLMSPFAVIFDQSDNMYITDVAANVIRKVNTSGIISTVAGNGTQGFSGDGRPATDAEFGEWVNCSAVDAGGNLFIADAGNNRIRRITYNSTGINNIVNQKNNITIYPNPATNTITLTSPSTLPNAEVKISNVLGEEVFNKTYSSLSQTDIDVGRFASGVYFIKVNGVYAGKFVKE